MSDAQAEHQDAVTINAPSAPTVPDASDAVEKPGSTDEATPVDNGVTMSGALAPSTAPTTADAQANSAPGSDGSMADATGDASNKKKEKRKSSGGVPEHKAKKLNRKKSIVLQLDAQPGDHYWARLKGFPPWPSIVCDDEMLPETLLQNRPVTAKRPDGSYREDFLEGGKNVRDRTYPVMYLGTYEFSWTNNTDITPLKHEELEISEGKGKKMSKALQAAYAEAEEQHELSHYKDKLAQFVRDREEAEEAFEREEERKAKANEEKLAKKEQKAKRKSKAAEDGDVTMEDAEGATPKDKKSKKRRKDADSEEEKPAKTPKTLKLSSAVKTPNGDSATKSKSKPKPKQASAVKPSAKAEPQLSEAEKKEKRQKEVLYFRHKLQKGFLTRDVPPKEEDMAQMAQYFENLEKYKEMDGAVIRETRIHKVLRGILKLPSIPNDEDYKFKERSDKLLGEWNKLLGEGEEDKVDLKTDGASTEPEKTVSNPEEAKKEQPADVSMPDVKADPVESGEEAAKKEQPKDSVETAAAAAPADKPTETAVTA